jgi:hypothetical protein
VIVEKLAAIDPEGTSRVSTPDAASGVPCVPLTSLLCDHFPRAFSPEWCLDRVEATVDALLMREPPKLSDLRTSERAWLAARCSALQLGGMWVVGPRGQA